LLSIADSDLPLDDIIDPDELLAGALPDERSSQGLLGGRGLGLSHAPGLQGTNGLPNAPGLALAPGLARAPGLNRLAG
jgi:hypothetical protein